jgi:2-phosphosulfolactate phosphatase
VGTGVAGPDRGDAFGQLDGGVRFEWGPTGAAQLAEHADGGCLVIVDVLSFTTSVSICVSRGISVFPYRWDDASAEDFATRHDAELAVRRRDVSADHPWSLSPAVLSTAPMTPRLVLPSPNGSTIAAAAAGVTLVAASLRNATVVARWLVDHRYGTSGQPALIVASGERWHDGSLRLALEDALGAGAVLHHLDRAGCTLSVEAAATVGMFEATGDVEAAVRSCGSARRMDHAGYVADVDMAVAFDADFSVPVLHDGAFSAS